MKNMISILFSSTIRVRQWCMIIVILSLQSILFAQDVTSVEDNILKNIREYRNKNGFPPTMDDCFSYLEQMDSHDVRPETVNIILSGILAEQKPSISLSNLLKLFVSKRHSLHDYIVMYDVHLEYRDKNGTEVVTCEFASKNNKLLFDVKRDSGKNLQDRLAYDGERVITLRDIAGSPKQAGILQESGLGLFFQPQMPLFIAGLFDSKVFGFPYLSNDVVSFLKGEEGALPDGTQINFVPFVFEKNEIVDGRRCIVVSDFVVSMYFDVEKDFSLIQIEGYLPIMAKNLMLTGRKLSLRTKLYELTKYDNGIWLPTKIEIERFNENPIKRENIIISSIKLNQGIKDTFFTDFIPDDALVSDAVNHLVYKQGDKASINSLLKDTVKSKRVLIFRYISIISGLALIFIALTMKYRQYLEDKRERENKMEEKK